MLFFSLDDFAGELEPKFLELRPQELAEPVRHGLLGVRGADRDKVSDVQVDAAAECVEPLGEVSGSYCQRCERLVAIYLNSL